MIYKVSVLLLGLICIWSCGSQKKEEALKKENEQLKAELAQKQEAQSLQQLEAKYTLSMQEMKTISNALESYITDWQKPPIVASLKELAGDSKFVPYYIKTLPYLDSWGNEYFYKQSSEGEYGTYWLGCSGSDGIFNGFEQEGRVTLKAGIDIVLSNGVFKLAPQ